MIIMTNSWLWTHKNYMVEEDGCEEQTRAPTKRRGEKNNTKNSQQKYYKFILFLFYFRSTWTWDRRMRYIRYLVLLCVFSYFPFHTYVTSRTTRINQSDSFSRRFLSALHFFLLFLFSVFFWNEIMWVCQFEHDVNYTGKDRNRVISAQM